MTPTNRDRYSLFSVAQKQGKSNSNVETDRDREEELERERKGRKVIVTSDRVRYSLISSA